MSWLTAALLACHTADPATVALVADSAIYAGVDPALALAVGVAESGLRGRNPLGVRQCYGRRNPQLNQAGCTALGVGILRRVKGDLAAYNNGPKRKAYAAKVAAIAAKIRRGK